jgi:pimeloyl-ACP methyl ester carboxylesterase
MPHVTSSDGTKIGFDKTGRGPALILVTGAFQDRSGLTAHAALLSSHFTVYNYDRRGRGESGDHQPNTQPYSEQREIEDIQALIQEAGGSARLFGGSSGAVLALDAAAYGLSIPKFSTSRF